MRHWSGNDDDDDWIDLKMVMMMMIILMANMPIKLSIAVGGGNA